jgi:DNA-binding response OmpR family regulator
MQAFQAGALDYMVKPFAPAELLARILAISTHATSVGGALLQVGQYTLDLHGRLLRRAERCLPLHASGFVLLRSLMQASPGVVTREALQAQLWEGRIPGSHPLRMHVYLLRQQLQACFGTELIETRRGMGYRFTGSDNAAA